MNITNDSRSGLGLHIEMSHRRTAQIYEDVI
jgi:hypothetical protein